MMIYLTIYLLIGVTAFVVCAIREWLVYRGEFKTTIPRVLKVVFCFALFWPFVIPIVIYEEVR